ncbi:UDP-N-acetylmuramoyl-tripeptide--D-alanyl-D-alanine ligase [Kitasatospora sp. MAP12-15]|uniref:UDP-N-acetylmuramoyl-tripeptide--D-alanyl-D- alanine ligase n=1 Tax=unclassified Kitasatospora TaxID=2633591 RepID=UPI0024730528|nr:UDP-N-acetylmuramoyl-tripeptide--D-alanyl-D-alanine ligase [Kitasatospora sp. MAP12-44]MDH6108275.1 UDP-N-acetylmuramoyl-tripeptide--D-alanyl-D-alanine ligase [Kitasatospora sp. MAP12-44]
MVPMTLQEIAETVGGVLHGVPDPAAVVDRPAVVDSRLAEPGSLFVALPGEHTDGHLFAAAAVGAGAVAVLASRPVDGPAIVVRDVLEALAALARAVLARLAATASPTSPTVIALTGSAGKTSTKDLLAQVLRTMDTTVATPLSFNNDIGLPLTVLHADAGTRHLLLEMGASRAGHIARLTGIAPPTIGLVINVGTAHLGEFGGSKEAIATAKSELVQALPADGLAVLNADDPYVMSMASRTLAPVLTFGRRGGEVRATGIALDEAGRPSFTLAWQGSAARVRLGMYGEHHVANATAAAAVALGLGAGLDHIAEVLSSARQLTPGRMEVGERPDGVTVVNDAFNANPDSMAVALRALAAMAGGRRRVVAVLGEMRELGGESESHHAELGRRVAAAGVTDLIAVGGAEALLVHDQARALGVTSTLVADRDAALELLRDYLKPGDLVLVKGSHSTGLEDTARRLTKADAAADERLREAVTRANPA